MNAAIFQKFTPGRMGIMWQVGSFSKLEGTLPAWGNSFGSSRPVVYPCKLFKEQPTERKKEEEATKNKIR